MGSLLEMQVSIFKRLDLVQHVQGENLVSNGVSRPTIRIVTFERKGNYQVKQDTCEFDGGLLDQKAGRQSNASWSGQG